MMIVPNAVVVAAAAEETPLPRVEIAFPPSSLSSFTEKSYSSSSSSSSSRETTRKVLKFSSCVGNESVCVATAQLSAMEKVDKTSEFLQKLTQHLVRLIYARRHTHRKREREKQCRPRRPLRARRRLCRAAAAAAFLLLRF